MDAARARAWVGLILGCVWCMASPNHGRPQNWASSSRAFKTVLQSLQETNQAASLQIVVVKPVTSPAFPLVLCSACACDLCNYIRKRGVFAPAETSIASRYILTPEDCAVNGGLVVDIGANIGYFTIMAAAAGCRVHAFEPNPAPRMLLQLSLQINAMHELVKVHNVAISEERSMGHMSSAPRWGAAKVTQTQATKAASSNSDNNSFLMRPILDYVQEDVLLMKVDTEGFEGAVFNGSWPLLQKYKVHNAVVEIKEFNSAAKRGLMQKIMVTGGFTRVYNYFEVYKRGVDAVAGPLLAQRIWDVTEIIENSILSVTFGSEDFWFRRDPLPHGAHTVMSPSPLVSS